MTWYEMCHHSIQVICVTSHPLAHPEPTCWHVRANNREGSNTVKHCSALAEELWNHGIINVGKDLKDHKSNLRPKITMSTKV